jgi:hypothetical protein
LLETASTGVALRRRTAAFRATLVSDGVPAPISLAGRLGEEMAADWYGAGVKMRPRVPSPSGAAYT